MFRTKTRNDHVVSNAIIRLGLPPYRRRVSLAISTDMSHPLLNFLRIVTRKVGVCRYSTSSRSSRASLRAARVLARRKLILIKRYCVGIGDVHFAPITCARRHNRFAQRVLSRPIVNKITREFQYNTYSKIVFESVMILARYTIFHFK